MVDDGGEGDGAFLALAPPAHGKREMMKGLHNTPRFYKRARGDDVFSSSLDEGGTSETRSTTTFLPGDDTGTNLAFVGDDVPPSPGYVDSGVGYFDLRRPDADTPRYSNFGEAEFYDDSFREYKMAGTRFQDSLSSSIFNLEQQKPVEQPKPPKAGQRQVIWVKIPISLRSTVGFPLPGDELTLLSVNDGGCNEEDGDGEPRRKYRAYTVVSIENSDPKRKTAKIVAEFRGFQEQPLQAVGAFEKKKKRKGRKSKKNYYEKEVKPVPRHLFGASYRRRTGIFGT